MSEEPGGPAHRSQSGVHRVREKLLAMLDDLIQHQGFGEARIDVKILKRGRREVVLTCGKQYRFVLSPEEEA